MNRRDVMGLIVHGAALWPAWRLPADPGEMGAVVDTWAAMLADTPADAALAALERSSLRGDAWPPPVGRLVLDASRLAGRPVAPAPDAAWDEITAALGAVGRYALPVWSHEAIGDAVRAMGGWRALCDSSNAMADRAHFLRLYEPIAERATLAVVAPPALRARLAALGTGRPETPDPPALPD